MRRSLLRALLVLDAAALFLVGAALLFAPGKMLSLFGVASPAPDVIFVLGVFGIVYTSLGIGYAIAVQNPLRHIAWIQVGIARAGGECLFGIVCVLDGLVTFRQAGLSIILPAIVAIGYAALYPRPEMPAAELTSTVATEGLGQQ